MIKNDYHSAISTAVAFKIKGRIFYLQIEPVLALTRLIISSLEIESKCFRYVISFILASPNSIMLNVKIHEIRDRDTLL